MPPNVNESALAALTALDLSDISVLPKQQPAASVSSSSYPPLTDSSTSDASASCPPSSSTDEKAADVKATNSISGGLLATKFNDSAAVSSKISTEDINKKYHVDYTRQIGRGTNTIVRKCIERSTGKRYAVKSVKKYDVEQTKHMRKEIDLLTDLEHPDIIDLHDSYEDDKYLHMVVEYCKGGELYDYVMDRIQMVQRMNGEIEHKNPVNEKQAAIIVRKVVDAVAYLHEHNIVHRDLKLENILFKAKQKSSTKACTDTDIRLIDFGLSRRFDTHRSFGSLQKLTSFVGTNYYVAPEILGGDGYTHSCDLWSIGVLAYALLSAKPPFNGRNDTEIYNKIRHCDDEGVKFPSPDWDGISDDAKDFITHLLVKDVTQRPGAAALKEHPWIKDAMDETPVDLPVKKRGLLQKAFRFGRHGG